MQSPSENNFIPHSETQRFATAILAARTQRQMSRAALAEQAGLPLQTVEELERGYPASRDVISALCRNLDLPEPALDSSPLVRFALLVRQRRGLARLSRAQLASKIGMTRQIIRSVETAALWPSQQVCMALLSVQALKLHESDVVAFLSPPSAPASGEATLNHEPPPARPEAASVPCEHAAPPHLPQNRPALSENAGPVRTPGGSLGNPVVATFLVRFYANGKITIEMRPPHTKRPRRGATPDELSRRLRTAARSS